jgi:hypothetical protein
MGICVNMIVKNESANLPRLFKSLENVVDFYVIYDTGSTDNTIEKIKELGELHNIKGIVFSEPWVNFAYNRNIALKKAFQLYNEGVHSCSWLLIIDADEALDRISKETLLSLDKNLSYNGYQLYRDHLSRQKLLISTLQQEWYWEGETHNYLINNMNYAIQFNEKFIRNALHFTGAKSHQFKNTEEKSAYDVAVLEKELNNTEINLKNIHRYLQIGIELFECKKLHEAFSVYNTILSTKIKIEEEVKFICMLQIGHIYLEYLVDLKKAEKFYSKAMELMPDRKEPYYYLVKLYQKIKEENKIFDLLTKGLNIPASNIKNGYRLVDYGVYFWKLEMEMAVYLFKNKQQKQFLTLYEQIIKQGKIPKEKLAIIQSMKSLMKI